MRPLAKCPCPRCLIRKTDIPDSGTKRDRRRRARKREDTETIRQNIQDARRFLYQGHAFTNARLVSRLDAQSLNPIQVCTPFRINDSCSIFTQLQAAFSSRLSGFSVNFYEIFAPDLMHEFELGVWKGVFKHLMRILSAQGKGTLETFNARCVLFTELL